MRPHSWRAARRATPALPSLLRGLADGALLAWLGVLFFLVTSGSAAPASGASGHAAAIDPLVAIPSKIVHLLGVAVWLGGLLWLVVMLHEPAERSLREASRVSTLALVAVILV